MKPDGLYPPEFNEGTWRYVPDPYFPPRPYKDPQFSTPICPDPNHHLPGVLMISLQPRQVYEHVCPSCGCVTRITQQYPIC